MLVRSISHYSRSTAVRFTGATGEPVKGASPRDIYTVGLRVKSLPGEFDGWDYGAELAGQLGRFKSSATSASLDHEAFAAHVAGGHIWTGAFGSPRLGVEYNFASGGSDATNGARFYRLRAP